MTMFSEAVRSAGLAIRANLTRSLLTALGIIIGVASVILMVAVGEGARVDIESKIASLGTNLLQLRPGSSRVRGRSVGADTRIPFSERDIAEIRTSLSGVVAVSGHLRRSATAVHRDANWLTNIDGVHPSYLEVRDWELLDGRFFGEEEYRSAGRLAVLGSTVVATLFKGQNAIGRRIRIADTPFDIIGVLQPKGADPTGKDQDDVILVPLSTVRARMMGRHKLVPDQVGYVSVKLEDEHALAEARGELKSLLERLRGKSEKGSEKFEIRDLAEYVKAKTATENTLGLLLAATAAISLVVGGIGIMNIMLVSVTERTREIGLRMAIGARRFDILFQFLCEAVILCLLGGIVGTLLGVGSATSIAKFANWPVLVTPSLILVALGAAALTGIGFGMLPARRAARLNPIDALRSE